MTEATLTRPVEATRSVPKEVKQASLSPDPVRAEAAKVTAQKLRTATSPHVALQALANKEVTTLENQQVAGTLQKRDTVAEGTIQENALIPEKQAKTAVEMYAMSREDRIALKKNVDAGTVDSPETKAILERATTLTIKKLESIGLTVEEYTKAYDALVGGDVTVVRELLTKSQQQAEKRRSESQIKSTIDTHSQVVKDPNNGVETRVFTPERQKKHQEIVAQVTAGVEKHFGDTPPRILFLAGPPGGGKSSAREVFMEVFAKGAGGYVSADPDSLRSFLMEDYDDTNNDHVLTTQEEAFYVSELIYRTALENKMNVIYEGTMRNMPGIQSALDETQQNGYRADVEFVNTDLSECFRRAVAYRDRAVALDFLVGAVKGYEAFATMKDTGKFENVIVYDNSSTNPNETGIRYQRSTTESTSLPDESQEAYIQAIHTKVAPYL